MIRPLPPPPLGDVIVIPVLPPKSNELGDVKVPPPVKVNPFSPHQVHVQLFADEIVTMPFVPRNKTCEDELPVTLEKVVIVCVALLTAIRLGAAIVSVPKVLAPLMTKVVMPELVALIVTTL